MAASWLREAIGPDYRQLDLPCWTAAPPNSWKLIDQLLAKPAIFTSSCGRLFDAVSALCGIRYESNYEGESAMLLEAEAARWDGAQSEGTYDFGLNRESTPWTIDMRPMIGQIAREISSGRPVAAVAHNFHESVARMIEAVCRGIRETNGVNGVCLSGGTFQNHTLLSSAAARLRASGFEVYLHALVPPNDGGVSLGQAVVAAAHLER
jgi:hydrogenase maturation protein HypF